MELINLKTSSSVCIALRIWENPDIKNKIRDLFLKFQATRLKITGYYCPSQEANEEYYKGFQFIVNLAIQHLCTIGLPLPLKHACEVIVEEMGEKIFNWIEFVMVVLKLDFKFAEKIYWLPDGNIDKEKIIKAWESDEEFTNQKILGIPTLYYLACVNVNEDFIAENLDKMETFLKIHMPDFNLHNYTNKVYILISYYLYLFVMSRPIFESDDFNMSPKLMFETCAPGGLSKSALYFWDHCKRSESQENPLRNLNGYGLDYFLGYPKSFTQTRMQRQKIIEILIFLINHMTAEERNAYFEKNLPVLFSKILHELPYHEILLDLIEMFSSKLTISNYQNVYHDILNEIQLCKSACSNRKIKHYREIFQKVCLSVPENLKASIFESKFINQYLDIFDMKCLSLVLNNIDQNLRTKLIKNTHPKILQLVEGGKMKELKEFMEEVLTSQDEREEIKKYLLNSINKILTEVNFEITNELLDILSVGEEERAIIKSKVNCSKICDEFIRTWKYDKAEKFLEWMFPIEEQRENFRNSLNPDWFICERTSKKFDKFLQIFLDSKKANQEDFFKFYFGLPVEKESVKNKKIYLSFRDKLYGNGSKKEMKIHNLSSSCLSAKKIVFNNLFYPSKHYFKFCDESELPDIFMKWICKDESRRNFIKETYSKDCERDFFFKIVFLMLG